MRRGYLIYLGLAMVLFLTNLIVDQIKKEDINREPEAPFKTQPQEVKPASVEIQLSEFTDDVYIFIPREDVIVREEPEIDSKIIENVEKGTKLLFCSIYVPEIKIDGEIELLFKKLNDKEFLLEKILTIEELSACYPEEEFSLLIRNRDIAVTYLPATQEDLVWFWMVTPFDKGGWIAIDLKNRKK